MNIPFFRPVISENTHNYAGGAISSVFWSGGTGPYFKSLVDKLRNMYGRKYCVLTNSGTSACRAALFAAIRVLPERNSVIVPSYSCSANIMPVIEFGKHPNFTQTDPCGCPKAPMQGVRYDYRDAAAVFMPHIYGCTPIYQTSFQEECHKNGSYLIADISQAVGVQSEEVVGDIIVGSLRTEKLLGCGEGGFLLTDDQSIYNKASSFCERGKLNNESPYMCVDYGDNLLMSGVHAAIAVGQMAILEEIIEDKIKQRARYAESEFFKRKTIMATNNSGVPWQTVAIFERYLASDVINVLKTAGIDCRPGFYPLQNIYSNVTGKPTTIDSMATLLWYHGVVLPTPYQLTNEEFNYIEKVLRFNLTGG